MATQAYKAYNRRRMSRAVLFIRYGNTYGHKCRVPATLGLESCPHAELRVWHRVGHKQQVRRGVHNRKGVNPW